jgi:hypothetical protein
MAKKAGKKEGKAEGSGDPWEQKIVNYSSGLR